MFKTNISGLKDKFQTYNLKLDSDFYCWNVHDIDSLKYVKNLLKDSYSVCVLLDKDYHFHLKELYLLGAKLVQVQNDLNLFLDKSLIAGGLMSVIDLGVMPFDSEMDLFVLHPVISIKENSIKAFKNCKIESVYLNHGFWSDKVIEKINEDDKFISVFFHENVSKINSKNVSKNKEKLSSDNILVYSKFIKENKNLIKANKLVIAYTIEEFLEYVQEYQFDQILFESLNDSKNLIVSIANKIKKAQPQSVKIAFLSAINEKLEIPLVSKNVSLINEYLLKQSINISYELNSFESFLYSKEKFKIGRISSDHIIMSTDKFINPDSFLLLAASSSFAKIYKNKIIGSKFYYWAHINHLSEENYKNFTRFLDKTKKL